MTSGFFQECVATVRTSIVIDNIFWLVIISYSYVITCKFADRATLETAGQILKINLLKMISSTVFIFWCWVLIFQGELSRLSEIKNSLAIFCMATYGEGDPTDNAQDFYDWLQENDDEDLSGLNYTVSLSGEIFSFKFLQASKNTDNCK